ncbi:MAG: hypothetical protein ACREBB_04080 [Nitrosotalea sp.]
MNYQNTVIALITLAVAVSTLVSMWYIRFQEKRRMLRNEYYQHVKDLIKSVYDSTDQHTGQPRKDDDFGKSVEDHQLKENILQHFFSYQETDHVKIFDLYLERIKLNHGTRTEFSHIFHRYFSEINTTSNSEFGVCKGCIDKFGFFDGKKKYRKILDSFPKDT